MARARESAAAAAAATEQRFVAELGDLNGMSLRTLLLTDDPCAARIACVGDLRAASLGQLSLVDGDGAEAAQRRTSLRRSATALWAWLHVERRVAA